MITLRRLRSDIATLDPLTRATCLISTVIGANGPVYPLSLYVMIGPAAAPVFITMLASPLFLAIALLARSHPRAARAALPALGTLNTLWCAKLLGGASGVELFLLPCISLATLSFTTRERWLSFALMAPPIALYLSHGNAGWLISPLLHFTPVQLQALRTLNAASVGMLTAFLGMTYARLRG
ncbi:hypothetical protein [Acidocella sp.]|nr:hypothetical protein [Acidocella sp.]